MFRNHLTIAFRNFWRNKTFSLINVSGLAIGISAALVIFLIVFYEFSYDKYEPDRDRIYRVVMNSKYNGMEGTGSAMPGPLGNAIEREVTGVEQTAPVFTFQGDATAKVSITPLHSDIPVIFKKQPQIVFTSPGYFYIIPFKWVAGSPEASMKDPFKVVLSESRAKQYFPSLPVADIVGKQITYNDELHATVSGVVKDLNETTNFTATEFISLSTIAKTNLQDNFMMTVWNDWMAYSQVYVKLTRGTAPKQVESQLQGLIKKHNKDANRDAANTMAFALQPLNDIHFNSSYGGFGQRLGNKKTLYGLLAIGSFLLLLGCINFINLTTAQATQRAKEIGVRKTMGGSRRQLILQFLSETFFITVIATLISLLLTPVLLRMFADFIPPGLHFDLLHQPSLILFLFCLVLTVSFLSGFYPAMILSGFQPALVLKGNAFSNNGKSRKATVRKSLTIAQFVIAQFFIIGTAMVSKQINYSLNSDLGFDKEAIVSFEGNSRDTVKSHTTGLLSEIKALPGVSNVSSGFLPPATEGGAFTRLSFTNGKDLFEPNAQIRWGDPEFINVFKLRLTAGRNVEPSDSIKEFIVNESFAKSVGFQNTADAINHMVKWNNKNIPIIGVMKDFHEQSLHSLMGPIVFGGNKGGFYHVKLKAQHGDGTQWKRTIAAIELAFRKVYPDRDFEYHFFDESIANFYQSEQNTASLLKWATGLAIFISCLGLLGLVIYTTNTRTKEIGIRKILGASVTNIIAILSGDFLKLVIIAFLIAAPVAWWATYKWLQEFMYRTPMSWWVFITSGLAMLLVALVTLSAQTVKTAVANPVKSLRTE